MRVMCANCNDIFESIVGQCPRCNNEHVVDVDELLELWDKDLTNAELFRMYELLMDLIIEFELAGVSSRLLGNAVVLVVKRMLKED